jgi:phage-related protein
MDAVNRHGGILDTGGASIRPIRLDMRVLTRLDTFSTGLQHLDDVKDQLRDAARYLGRVDGSAPLYIGDTDRYINAVFSSMTMSLVAGEHRRASYSVTFQCEPFFISNTPLSDTVTGNDTLSVTFTDNTAETYPIFEIPSGVTAATFTTGGKTLTFTRGSVTGALTIDCGRLTVTKDSDGTNQVATVTEVDWGFSKTGTGAFNVVVTGYAGSGTITMEIPARYEL